jgi:hypothetical protein
MDAWNDSPYTHQAAISHQRAIAKGAGDTCLDPLFLFVKDIQVAFYHLGAPVLEDIVAAHPTAWETAKAIGA